MKKAFHRSYWVVPGQLMAGCYPGHPDKSEACIMARGLIDAGIHLVLNLMEETETDWSGKPFRPYDKLVSQYAKRMNIIVNFIRIPIKDTSVPDKSTMIHILDIIDQAIDAGHPVYIHCWGGHGRTGTVVGCYLVRHGIATGDEALKRINQLRQEWCDPTYPKNASPETLEQIKMVLHWQNGW